MATRATLRARVRRELGDGGAVYLWSDEQVNDHLADAIRELGRALPRGPVAATLTTVAGQREYAIGAAVAAVVGLEYPVGRPLPRAGGPAGTPATGTPDLADTGYAQEWTGEAAAGTVRLRNAPAAGGEALRVVYRPLPTPPSDDATAVAVAPEEEAIVALLACRSLWESRVLADAKRGLRTPGDNPFAARVAAMLGRRREARGNIMRDE